MRRLLSWAGAAAVVAAAFAFGLRPETEPTAPASADAVAASLRCPVCQGLSVKDSDSPTARDMRADIAGRLEAGQTPTEIRQAYVERFGRWVLLRPRSSGFEVLVWVVPAATTAAAAVVLSAAFWRWRQRNRTRPPTDEDRQLVATAAAATRAASDVAP